MAGISPSALHLNDKGDLLVTAASNVHGPAPQVAGLPKWKEENDMPVTGALAGLLAKFSGVGTATKAALAGVTAVTTMGLAGGAAGVLPGPAQSLVAAAVNTATPFQFPAAGAGGASGAVEHAVQPLSGVGVTVPQLPALNVPPTPPMSVAAPAGAKAGPTGAGIPASSTRPNLPAVTVPALPTVTLPPAVANLVKGLPACVTNLIPAGGGTPDPARLATEIPGCITQVLGTASVPPEVARCVAAVLGAIGGASGMKTANVPGLSGLSVSACVPMDVSKCVSNMLGLLGTLPGTSGGAIPGLGSPPGLSSVTGCAPTNLRACITALANAASSGATPKLDLSTCMPTTSGVPGAGSLPGLAGLGGALPFFGR